MERAAFGALPSFRCGCSACEHRARRARGYPPGAHASAVGGWRHQLRCGARFGVAPQNSRRSLRSLRSDSCGESVHDARTACAPTPKLRSSPPPKSPLTGTPCRDGQHRGAHATNTSVHRQRRVRAGSGAHGRRREAQGLRPARVLARIVNRLEAGVSERRERSERSELPAGPRDRASQGTRSEAEGAEDKHQSLPGRAFARANARAGSAQRTSATG